MTQEERKKNKMKELMESWRNYTKQILSEEQCIDILDNATGSWKSSKVGPLNYESKERISSEQTSIYDYGKLHELKEQFGIQELPMHYKLVRYEKGDGSFLCRWLEICFGSKNSKRYGV